MSSSTELDHLRRVAAKISSDERERAADDPERQSSRRTGWHRAEGPGSTNVKTADYRGPTN